jgi:hypothetical protein
MGTLAEAFQTRSGSRLPAKVDAIAQTATDAKANVLMGVAPIQPAAARRDDAQDEVGALMTGLRSGDH